MLSYRKFLEFDFTRVSREIELNDYRMGTQLRADFRLIT